MGSHFIFLWLLGGEKYFANWPHVNQLGFIWKALNSLVWSILIIIIVSVTQWPPITERTENLLGHSATYMYQLTEVSQSV